MRIYDSGTQFFFSFFFYYSFELVVFLLFFFFFFCGDGSNSSYTPTEMFHTWGQPFLFLSFFSRHIRID